MRKKVFMEPQNEIDPRLMRKLGLLQISPERNPENEEAGITAFIQEAQKYAEVVTTSGNRRHNQWLYMFQSILMICRKEQSPMFSTLVTIVLIVSLVLGGGGITIAAAQNSQPDQPLYGVKVLSEDIQMGFSTDPQSEYQLALEFTNRRSEEIRTMAQAGNPPPETVQARYQNQVEQAIQFAVNLPDAQAVPALQQVQTRLQAQQQALANGTPQTEATLLKVRQMLQERLQWVAAGVQDPASLREQFGKRDPQRKQDGQGSATPQGPANTQPAAITKTGSGNPQVTGTPTPGSGYGPGKGTATCENCTPTVNGNPWTTGTPTPGSSYGPGPGLTPTGTHTPGSGYGPGPQPTQAGPQPTQQQNQPTQAGPQPTQQQNQPTQAGPQATQQQNQPTQAGPKATQGPQSTSAGPGPQSTAGSGGPGGKR